MRDLTRAALITDDAGASLSTFRKVGAKANDASTAPLADASNWRRLTAIV
jgi:hypothetical protein